MTAFFTKTMEKIWGVDTNPYTFMQLLAASGGVPNMTALETDKVSMLQKIRVIFDDVADEIAEEIHMMSYGYFDLMEENGQMRRLQVAKPANDNFRLARLKIFRAA